jgi:hypothetical protein
VREIHIDVVDVVEGVAGLCAERGDSENPAGEGKKEAMEDGQRTAPGRGRMSVDRCHWHGSGVSLSAGRSSRQQNVA